MQVVDADHIGAEPLDDGGVPLAEIRPRERVVLVTAATDEGLLATGLVGQAADLELAAVGGEIVLVALDLDLRQGRGQRRTEGDQGGRQLGRGRRISTRRVREATRARWGGGHGATHMHRGETGDVADQLQGRGGRRDGAQGSENGGGQRVTPPALRGE